jgi:hypothetical protein
MQQTGSTGTEHSDQYAPSLVKAGGWHTEEVLQGTVVELHLLLTVDHTVDQVEVHINTLGLLTILGISLGGSLHQGDNRQGVAGGNGQ